MAHYTDCTMVPYGDHSVSLGDTIELDDKDTCACGHNFRIEELEDDNGKPCIESYPEVEYPWGNFCSQACAANDAFYDKAFGIDRRVSARMLVMALHAILNDSAGEDFVEKLDGASEYEALREAALAVFDKFSSECSTPQFITDASLTNSYNQLYTLAKEGL